MNISNELLNSITKQKCQKCGREDIGIVITSDNRKICFDCEEEEKRVVKVKMNNEIKSIIRELSVSLRLSISSILRNILNIYKDKSEVIEKIDSDDYSQVFSVRIKGCSSLEYQEYKQYADRISNQDIIIILKEIFEKIDKDNNDK